MIYCYNHRLILYQVYLHTNYLFKVKSSHRFQPYKLQKKIYRNGLGERQVLRILSRAVCFWETITKNVTHLTLWNHEQECCAKSINYIIVTARDRSYLWNQVPKRTEVYKNKAVFPGKDEPFFYPKLVISNANRNAHLHRDLESHMCSLSSCFLIPFLRKEYEVGEGHQSSRQILKQRLHNLGE